MSLFSLLSIPISTTTSLSPGASTTFSSHLGASCPGAAARTLGTQNIAMKSALYCLTTT